MKIEEVQVWVKAKELVTLIYGLFRNNKDYGFREFKYINQSDFQKINDNCTEISKMLGGFIKKISN